MLLKLFRLVAVAGARAAATKRVAAPQHWLGLYGNIWTTISPTGKQWKVDSILSAVQASHQKMAWTAAGVDIRSQEGYELAAQGGSSSDIWGAHPMHIRIRTQYANPDPGGKSWKTTTERKFIGTSSMVFLQSFLFVFSSCRKCSSCNFYKFF